MWEDLKELTVLNFEDPIRVWTFLMQGFGASINNTTVLRVKMLEVYQLALTNPHVEMRETLLAWRFYLESSFQEGVPIDLEAMLEPLKKLYAKDDLIAKVQVWLFLIEKLAETAVNRFEEVTIPLLELFFTPSGAVPNEFLSIRCSFLACVLSPSTTFKAVSPFIFYV